MIGCLLFIPSFRLKAFRQNENFARLGGCVIKGSLSLPKIFPKKFDFIYLSGHRK